MKQKRSVGMRILFVYLLERNGLIKIKMQKN